MSATPGTGTLLVTN